MARYRTRKRSDRKFFRRTADKVKSVNVRPMIMRGGFRL